MFATPATSSLVIRPALDADAAALERLAKLDTALVPAGEKLVAEVGGELVAAYGVERGERIGDPFRPTADVVSLLRERASQVGGPRAERGPGLRLLARSA